MPRKKPFSMKQKKRQLKEKREKKRGEGDDLSPSHSRSASRDRTAGEHRDGTGTVPGQRRLRRHDEEEGDEVAAAAGTRGGRQHGGSDDDGGAGDDGGDGGDGGELPPRGPARPGVRRINEQPVEERRGGRHDPNRYRLHFAREGREEVERRKRLAQQQPLLPLLANDPTALEVTVDTAYPPGSVLDFPCRPHWLYSMTREEVRANEERAFRDYLARIHGAYPAGSLSYFEHNLETWRQLWRVLEMSDVILLITDVRHPVLHFCPSLHDHVVRQCGRSLVLVLNKVDLVEASLVSAWRAYFTARFPGTRVVCFTSRPDGGGGGVAAPGEVDLSSWAEKISSVDKEDDEDDDEDEEDDDDDEGGGGRRGEVMGGRTVRVEHLSDVAMGLPGAPTEPFKDGVLTVGCVGFPNVGKSSLINGLVGRKVVSVSRTPGHTKYFQTYFLTPTVRLCDCPGLIFPSLIDKQQQILAGIYPISQIQEPYTAIGFLAQRIPLPRILNLRRPAAPPRGGGTGAVARGEEELGGEEGEEAPWTAWEICEVWAEQRGFHTARTARPDVYRAANSILRLAVEGRLSLAMHPPGYTANHESWLTHPDTLEMQEMQERYRTLSTGAAAPDATDRDDEEDDEEEDDEEEEERCSRNAFQILAGDDA